jgi:hypothetical protein
MATAGVQQFGSASNGAFGMERVKALIPDVIEIADIIFRI